MKKTRVVVVDDSPTMRGLLVELLSADPGVDVVGTAADPYIAREKIKRLAATNTEALVAQDRAAARAPLPAAAAGGSIDLF